MKSEGGAIFTKQKDLSVLMSGNNPATDTYTLTFDTGLADITGIRLEVLPDKSLRAQGPGRAPNGNFVLNELKLEYVKRGATDKANLVKLIRPQATFSQSTFPIANAVDGNAKTGWAIAPQSGKPQSAIFELQNKIGTTEGTTLTVTLQQNHGGQHTIGKFRISVTTTRAADPLEGHGAAEHREDSRNPEGQADAGTASRAGQPRAVAGRGIRRLQRSLNDYVVPASARVARRPRFGLGADEQPGVLVQSLKIRA